MKYILTCLILCFVTLGAYSNDPLYFSNLSLNDGLSQITVTSVFQDKKGYMWFGTRNGLNRFNGYHFDIFVNEPGSIRSISDNHILCISESKDGNLWIGTNSGLNKLNTETNEFTRYFHSEESSSSLSHNMVPSLYYDSDNNLWIGTNNGLSLYDKENDSFIHTDIDGLLENNPINTIFRQDDNLYLGTSFQGLIIYNVRSKTYTIHKNDLATNVRSVFVDKDGNLWIGTYHNGLYVRKNKSADFVNYNTKNGLTNDNVRCISESPEGNILVGTFNGLNIIDPKTNVITQYKTYGSEEGNLSHYSIYSIYYDKSHTLWVGTYAGGVDYYSPYGQKFRFSDPNATLHSVMGIIGTLLEIEDHLYIATEGGGLLEMDKSTKTLKQYKLFKSENSSYTTNILKSLFYDGTYIFCGTNLGTIYTFDLKSKEFKLFYDFKQENSIYHISKNSDGDVIIGGVNQIGVTLLTKDGKTISKFPVAGQEDVSFHNVRCIYELKDNIFLIGTRNDGLYYYDWNKKTLERFYHKASNDINKQLPENYITDIFKDSAGNIWIATFGGGLCRFDIATKTFEVLNIKNGLLDNNICAISEDNNRHLWVSSISGISDISIDTKEITTYSYSSGIRINEFTPHAGLRLSDGIMVFSGNNGFISFNPRKMSVNPYIPPIELSGLYINNEKVNIGDRSNILDKSFSSQRQITLTYAQANNLAIEYIALNYIFSDRNQYAYMLEGFDNAWNDVGTRRMAYYTNIPPGEYVFKVRASNNDGVWNYEGTSVIIKVLPPFWRTWWAYTLYVVFVIAVAYFILRYFYERKRLENEVKLEQAESKAREEFHQARNKLFTNFSHELRTPLTLILSPLEDMVQNNKDLPEKVQKNHRLMYSNSLRLLRLVNNLMDFQKKESGSLKLKIHKGDFIDFSKEMVSLFEELAYSRDITLEFNAKEDELDYNFDLNLMEKVYFNFLSNAFKNTPNHGKVSVSVDSFSFSSIKDSFSEKAELFSDKIDRYIVVKIEDSGVGIESEELEKIFIPFYQVAQNEHSSSGTGLGLSLSKAIIEMHCGTVWAESPENSGAVFISILPVLSTDYKDEEVVDLMEEYPILYNKPESGEEKLIITSASLPKGSYTILVVEDNVDVREYIISHLADTYKILEASNGSEAIDKAINNLPDLIISDLMMPKMDGMEMTQILKTDLRTSHIPIVLLTAKSMLSDIKEGYENGADDYITKPFNASVLTVRVNNIIQSREKLKELYGKRFSLETLGVETTSVDERFMQKLYQVLEKNVSNPELKLDGFSKEIGMSKANLYRKIKALTDLSPNEFIRNFRLEMAAKILKESQLPISDVYVAVGFNSHAYFSNCFKSFYGVTPSEYASQNAENGNKS